MTTVKSLVPKDGFNNSVIKKIAKKENGKIVWIPTYNFGEMFDVSYLKDIDIDYKYLFSSVVEIKGSYYENGVFSSLDEKIEKPILILNFKENFFEEVHKNSIPVEEVISLLLRKTGKLYPI